MRLVIQEAHLCQLAEPLGDFGQLRPRPHRHHDVVGCLPAELLGRLEGEGLGALGVVRAQVDVHEGPRRVLGRQLGAESVDVVVAALDGDQVVPVHRRHEHLAPLEVGGNEDVVLHPGSGRVGGDRVGEVARRRAGRHLEAEFARPRQGDGDDAVLERARWIQGVVLDPELAQPQLGGKTVGTQERREARAKVDGAVFGRRKEIGVAPDRPRAGGDRLACRIGGDCVVVVTDFEGTEAVVADVQGLGRIRACALPTCECFDESH